MAGTKKAATPPPTFYERYRSEVLDVASRAAKTFVQTLTAQLTVGALVGGDVVATKAALVAAVAAAVSVVWNAAIAYANS